MKYLVNNATKEHIAYDPVKSPSGYWRLVEADSEGWIPWSGGECPLPDDCECNWLLSWEKSNEVAYRDTKQRAGALLWRGGEIVAYRPILTEQSEPAPVVADVFHRLRTATEHAASIPSIIAEIDELLGPEWTVVRVEKVEATAPQEDMSDWRNWKPGDLVECQEDYYEQFTAGALYRVSETMSSGIVKFASCDNGRENGWQHQKFRFHSRPTGATK